MKNLSLLFLFIFANSYCQKKNDCKSSEKEIYQIEQEKKWENYEFVPITKEDAIVSPYDFIKVDFLKHPSTFEYETDSISLIMQKYEYLINSEFIEAGNSDAYMDNFSKYMNIEDSLRR